jgi:hypothetical protein
MSESKIVYVNNDDVSDNEDENLIYGAASKTPETDQSVGQVPPEVPPVKPEAEEPEAEEPEAEEPEAEEPEQETTQVKANEVEEEEEEKKNEDENANGGSVFGGDDGYRSEPDDASSVSSLDTDAILNVDPLYFRLTKFLQTGGEEPENVAEILKKINTNLELMNQNLMNLMNAKSTQ